MRRKLAASPTPGPTAEIRRTEAGKAYAAKVPPRHIFDRVMPIANGWASKRKFSGATRSVAEEARRFWCGRRTEAIRHGGVRPREKGRRRMEEWTKLLRPPTSEPPPPPPEIEKCLHCGKEVEDSLQ